MSLPARAEAPAGGRCGRRVVGRDGRGGSAGRAQRLISHGRNQGKGKALLTGFDYAIQRGVDAAITLDADGQHDPDEIPLFIEAFRSGQGDIIIGKRTYGQMPAKSQFGNRVGSFLLRLAMGHPIPDNQSGYRLFSLQAMQKVRPTSTRFEAEVEMLLRADFAGLKVGWVPIKTIYNDKKSHFRPDRGQRALPQDDVAYLAGAHAGELRVMDSPESWPACCC